MANYVIEGTVSELTKEGTKISVKIVGTEGYAIKQGDKTYNVFCPKDLLETGNCDKGYIVDSKIEFIGNKDFENILTQASMYGKKIRLAVSERTLKKHIQESAPAQELNSSAPAQQEAKGKTAVDIKSVTLL
ncbi:MAG: hypothetical protein HDR32_11835 [Treponema sp.]|nr:hypothetical protein [Treponema sp.]